MNRLKALGTHGQSIWLDYIGRALITSGALRRLIDEDGVSGVTSNPAIFQKAIAGSSDYDEAVARAVATGVCEPQALYEALAIEDIQLAADVLEPVYRQTNRRDGYVSLEVSPALADDTAGTIDEARRLWRAVGRHNLMIKVPATSAGIPAIRQLIAEGLNVNVTLLFAVETFERVAEAYLSGLEERAAQHGDVSGIASVASFFVSRIDTAIDPLLSAKAAETTDDTERSRLLALAGRAAIVNARLAYRRWGQLFSGPRWQALADRGARPQRLLWASTGTKNPVYRDTRYVEELIGPDTVNTLPPATMDAFRDHGVARTSLSDAIGESATLIDDLAAAGIHVSEIADRLLADGVQQFVDAFRGLLASVADRLVSAPGAAHGRASASVPPALAAAVRATLDDWDASDSTSRLWAGDASLWTNADESRWLGWLRIVDHQIARIDEFEALRDEVRRGGFSDALLLGMGGSSLCPDVLRKTFGRLEDFPALHVIDSTDPGQINETLSHVDLHRTLVLVSSKSGTTLEPNILLELVYERMRAVIEPDEVGSRFIAITDPGSALERVALARRFRRIAYGWPDIGGRYSAFSDFGLVPAAVMGLDIRRFLSRTARMVRACAPCMAAGDHPGVHLGILLGEAARAGRDKLTIVASPAIASLGAWLEQLIAESTGKNGRGIVPVDLEPPGTPDRYGSDRLFVYVRLDPAPDPAQDAAVDRLEQAGFPVIRIPVADVWDLGQEFFRWEFATAVAGAVLGIHPFDQPDVEASKVATQQLTDAYEEAGSLPAESPIFSDGTLTFFADPRNAAEILSAAGPAPSAAAILQAHLGRLAPNDYAAILAYVPMNEAHQDRLQSIRQRVRDRHGVATCLGFGPRFLHSTGQVYKGGPNSGVFLQITCDDRADLPVPCRRSTFGIVKAAQARGDFQVLAERGRRALRVHLGRHVEAGLLGLERAMAATQVAR